MFVHVRGMTKERFRWTILGVAWITSIVAFVSQQSPPPLMPLIMNDLGITHVEGGLLMAMFSIPGVFAIPIGLLTDRFGARKVGAMAVLSLTIGSFIVASSPSFKAILVGRLIGGIGSISVFVVAPAVISQWFIASELGTAMGIYGTGLPVGTVIAFNLLGKVGIAYDWRLTFYIVGVINILVLALFWCSIREAPLTQGRREDEDHDTRQRFRSDLVNREAWKVGLYFLLFMAGWVSFSTWAPTLLSQFKGVSLSSAGFLGSLPLVVSLLCMPLLGWFSDRLRRRKVLIMTGPLLIVTVLLIIPQASGLTLGVCFLIMGLAFALVPPTVFGITGEALGPDSVGTSFGILITCSSIGQAVGPVIVGLVQDMTASLPQSLAVVGFFMLFSIILGYQLKT